MPKGTKIALSLAAIPFLMLVLALPLVNQIRPFVLGLPFLLFWLVLWIFLTPFILMAAYWAERKFNKKGRRGKQ
jgi:Protein of unknown function (DUF3311)